MTSRSSTKPHPTLAHAADQPFGFDLGFRLTLVLEPDGRVRGVTEVSGIDAPPKEAFIGRTLMEISARRDGGPARAQIWEERLAVARNGTEAVHYRDPPPGAAADVPHSVDCTVTPVRAADGTLQAILVGVDDRTSYLDTQKRLVESESQLRGALALTGLGRYVVDLTRAKLDGDERVAEIIGLQPDVLMSGSSGIEGLFALIHEDDAERVRATFAAATAGGADFDAEYRINRPTDDGTEERWIRVLGRVEFDGHRAVRIVGVIEDTTDRRREEEARLRMQKRDAIGTLAGGIAHDFNNVIGAILSNASLAQREIQAGESPAMSVTEIARGAVRATHLVRGMLDYSREEEPKRTSVDVGAVVREACALLRPTLPLGTELRVRIEPELLPVLADASQLHQVVMNLVTNARQAITAGGGRIDVMVDRTRQDAKVSRTALPAGEYISITVHDNGAGMPEAVMKRAFDPFFTTKPAGEGTGLGLAAASTIVRSFGGRMTVRSVLGHGSTFAVLLPVSHQPWISGEAPTATPTAAPAAKLRVLFVDDEPALARLAERAMPAYGCVPTAFTDPAKALAALAAEPDELDALVTDLSMPGMNGFELIEQVRTLRPDLPVVLTSGFLSQVHRDEAANRRVDQIIPKPCSIDDLVAAVRAVVDASA